MLTNLALLLWILVADPTARAPEVSPAVDRIVPVTFGSEALAGQRRYLVWLPPGYDPDRGEHPVVVFLHGLGGQGADWFDPALGDLRPTLSRLMREGAIAPFIALAPDGGGGYWTDHLGAPRERYGAFIDEVIAHAATRYPIAPSRAAIVGVSMGGHGAMSRALAEPTRYRAVVAIAGALFPEPPTHRAIYKKVWGFPADREHWARTAPMALVARLSPDRTHPAIFLACGRADTERFLGWSTEASRLLAARQIPHELVLADGGHTWPTWRSFTERWLTWLAPQLRAR